MSRYPYYMQGACIALLLLMNTAPAAAQQARDPTLPPTETGVATPSTGGVEGMTVLIRDNKPYLMVGARLYAPGDTVGNLRVERIAEKEVWFHDGNALIKVPRFAGIERRSIVAKSACAAPVGRREVATTNRPSISKIRASKTRAKRSSPAPVPTSQPAVAPCEDAQQ